MRPHLLLQHAAHVVGPIAGLLLIPHPAFRWAASAWLFFGLFTLHHDAMHGALQLPRAVNEWVIAVAGALTGVSGHLNRYFHLRHHARPLADDDVEGRTAAFFWTRALWEAPRLYLTLPWLGWTQAPRSMRWVSTVEWAAVALLYTLGWSWAVTRPYVLVAAGLQLTITFWASWVPHAAPGWLLAGARRWVWTRSPVVVGLVFHLDHHRRPRIPTYAWPEVVEGTWNREGAERPSVGRGWPERGVVRAPEGVEV